ncbi:hypothetical protein M758_4G250200, partial [Ceratodon purpureus]
RHRQIGRLGTSRATFFGSNGTKSSFSGDHESIFAIGRELGFGRKVDLGFEHGRSGLLVKSQENDKVGPQVDDNKPFYAALEFRIQVAVVILTLGFVDAGYSGDWSRIGALSRETEAQLRTAAYVIVPLSAALVWVVGNRKRIS